MQAHSLHLPSALALAVFIAVVAVVVHTWHILWTEICEISQNFQGDLKKNCEIVPNSLWDTPPHTHTPTQPKNFHFNFKKLETHLSVVNDYFFIKCVLDGLQIL